MTYSEAIGFLHGLQVFGLHPGLGTTLELAERCGSPQNKLRFIHIAGTNGKGSVCALLEAMHRRAGRRVGLYTSPHLVSFGERIQVDRQPMPEPDVVRWVENVRTQLDRSSLSGRGPTFFEFVTVMALGYFAEHGCDLVIWETGLGGRLDATNIVTPEASVITNIELDHQSWLGSTHDAIASEKAGIVKAGMPVVTGARPGRGLDVIVAVAGQLGCPVTIVDSGRESGGGWASRQPVANPGSRSTVIREDAAWDWVTQGQGGDWPRLSLAGRHQRTNAAVALATVKAMENRWQISETAMRAGLESAVWPGRMQLVRRFEDSLVLLDGAHNPAGAEALREGVAEIWPAVRPALILGVLADKDWEVMVRTLAPMASRILTVPVGSTRSLAPETLAAACRQWNPGATVLACPQLADALAATEGERHMVIAGSLYLVGEVMERWGVAVAPGPSERALNEWKSDVHR